MTSKPTVTKKEQDPLAEDELTEAEIIRYQQSQSRAGQEIFGGFSPYKDDCRRQSGRPGNGHWAVAWSDLMMTMFILFVVLYAYQISLFPPVWGEKAGHGRADAVIGGEKTIPTATPDDISPPHGHALATFYDESLQVLQRERISNIASVDLVPDKSVRIILTGELLFPENSDFLQEKARRTLNHIVPLLTIAPYQIQVVGHTDDRTPRGDTNANWQLSMGRALSVARFLMESGGLEEDRFTIIGKAGTEPMVSNDSVESRQLNRRVEIILAEKRPDRSIQIVKPVELVTFKTVLGRNEG